VEALSSTTIVSASRDTTIRIWNIETGECEAILEGHTSTIRTAAVHGDTLVSSNYDCTARVWSLSKKTCLHVLNGHENKVFSVAFDGKRIVTGSLDKTARLWDPSTGFVCPHFQVPLTHFFQGLFSYFSRPRPHIALTDPRSSHSFRRHHGNSPGMVIGDF